MVRIVLALCAALLGAPALAAPPPEIAARLEQMGRVIAAPPTLALYAPLQPADPGAGLRMERDVAYGADPANRLDVFAPAPLSPRDGLAGLDVPLFIAWAGLNPERFVAESEALVGALHAAGRTPVVLPLPGQSYISEVTSIGAADTALTGPLAAFIRR